MLRDPDARSGEMDCASGFRAGQIWESQDDILDLFVNCDLPGQSSDANLCIASRDRLRLGVRGVVAVGGWRRLVETEQRFAGLSPGECRMDALGRGGFKK
jgi:hypothetical protein